MNGRRAKQGRRKANQWHGRRMRQELEYLYDGKLRVRLDFACRVLCGRRFWLYRNRAWVLGLAFLACVVLLSGVFALGNWWADMRHAL